MDYDGFTPGMIFGMFMGAIAVFAVVAIGFLPQITTHNYNQGYCAAQGGEIISGDVCAKDSQIIPIPPRP